MKKVFVGGLLVVFGLWMLTVGLFGRLAATKIDDQIAEINRDLTHRSIPVSLTKYSYEAGLLSSTSQVQVTIDLNDKEPMQLDVGLDIYHGPLMFSSNGLRFGTYYILFTPDLSGVLQKNMETKKLLSGFAGRDPLTGGVLIGFQDRQTIDLALSPFEYSEEQGSLLLENGVIGTFSSDDQFSTLNGRVEFGAFSVDDKANTTRLDVAPSTLSLSVTEMYAGNVLTGDISYTLASLNLRAEGADHRVENLSINSFSDKNDSGLYGKVAMLLETISSSHTDFNALFERPLTARLDFNYRGLDEQAIRDYADINQKIQQQTFSALFHGDSTEPVSQLSDEEVQAFVSTMVAMFKQGFGFEYEISLMHGDESSDFKLNFDWLDDQPLMHKKTLREVLNSFQAEIKMEVDKSLIGGTPLMYMAQVPMAMGYAVETERSIASEAQFKQGELTLNGQSIPYMQMIGSSLDAEVPWLQ